MANSRPISRGQLDVPTGVHGVVVTNADDPSGELRKGDVIEEVNQQPVDSWRIIGRWWLVRPEWHPRAFGLPKRMRTRSFVRARFGLVRRCSYYLGLVS